MGDKKSTLVLDVDLDCRLCYKKIRKVLCRFPEIQSQSFDHKQKKVIISGPFDPEKLTKKLYCKAGCKTIKGCVVPKPPPPPKPDPPPKPAPPPPEPCPPEPPKPAPPPPKLEPPPLKLEAEPTRPLTTPTTIVQGLPPPKPAPPPPKPAPPPAKPPCPPPPKPDPPCPPEPPKHAPCPPCQPEFVARGPVNIHIGPVAPPCCCRPCYEGNKRDGICTRGGGHYEGSYLFFCEEEPMCKTM